MNSPLRVLLLVASVLGLACAIFFASRSAPKRAQVGRDETSSAREEERVVLSAPSPLPAVASARSEPVAALPAAPRPVASAASEEPSADSLAAAMHALEDSAPERALALARRGQALWPTGPRAPEFAATEVKCLYRLGKPSEGRGAAEAMVNRYPTSPWALEVEKQTGAHPYVDH